MTPRFQFAVGSVGNLRTEDNQQNKIEPSGVRQNYQNGPNGFAETCISILQILFILSKLPFPGFLLS